MSEYEIAKLIFESVFTGSSFERDCSNGKAFFTAAKAVKKALQPEPVFATATLKPIRRHRCRHRCCCR